MPDDQTSPKTPNGWHWMEARNNTGHQLTIQWGPGTNPLIIPPGRWRYTWPLSDDAANQRSRRDA